MKLVDEVGNWKYSSNESDPSSSQDRVLVVSEEQSLLGDIF
jgi:hypothetical protein